VLWRYGRRIVPTGCDPFAYGDLVRHVPVPLDRAQSPNRECMRNDEAYSAGELAK